MRILQVAHGYPPDQMAGAEVYTWTVAREQAARGHDVTVLAPTPREGHAEHELIEEELDGVHVVRLVQNFRGIDRLERTYRDPAVGPIYADLLERVRPDVVHVQHTIGLSSDVLPLTKAAGVPLVMTLHDFWYHCPRGQRITPGLHVCEKVEPWRCATCVGRKRAAYGVRWVGEVLRGESRDTAGEGPLTRAALLAPRAIRYATREAWRAPILRRLDEMRDALLACDLLLAPSQFLLERFVEQGIPREKLQFSEYGMNDAPFRATPPRPERDPAARPVRFGFTGTLIPNKGADVLLRAFDALPHGEATLEMHGVASGPNKEAYEAELRAISDHPGITWRGRFDNRRIAEVLGELDVLVVPSKWWENAPLTIHESVMARMPVVVSGHGGMTELAERFGNALQFTPSDATDLARVLRRFLDEPGVWSELVPSRPVRSVEDDVDGLLALYERVVQGA